MDTNESNLKTAEQNLNYFNLSGIKQTAMLAKLEGELDTLDRLNTLELKPYQFIEDEIYKNLVTYNNMYDQGVVDSLLNYEIASRVNELIMRNSEFTTHFNQNIPDDRLPDARFHIEHAETIKRNREASLKALTQSQDNSGIKTLFSDVLKVNDTACGTNSEKRFNEILHNIKSDDILVITSDAFIVNKLQGKNPTSKENKEMVTWLESENKTSAMFITGDKYKQWMNSHKEDVIQYFSTDEKTSYVAELAIPADDRASIYALQEEAMKNIQTGKQFIRELQGLSSTDMSRADTLKSMERVKL